MSNKLIDSLTHSSAYPHAVGRVTVRETHISWVLLTGDFAYKIKKPVRFDFLDFSTLELRHKYCQEELRLNRRYAPDLYLEVIPVTGTADAAMIGGTGEVLDYAVRMRQFDESGLLSRMLREERLTSDLVEDLAVQVACFHKSADILREDQPYAKMEATWKAASDNLTIFTEQALSNWPNSEREFTEDAIRRIRTWTEMTFQEDKSLFVQRRSSGAVRECHGDLHLNNIVLIGNRLTMFDGIEFNPEFHWIDVLSDVAFLVMDLEDNGGPELSHHFLNSYLEQTGDYQGLKVLKWYLVYRAMVRAKVALIRCGQPETSPEIQAAARESTRNYLHLALKYIAPEKPELFITCGASGSGKTFGTREIVDKLGAIRVRSDIERKRISGLAPLEKSQSALGQGIYTPASSSRVYEILAGHARTMLEAGFTTILDATYLKQADRAKVRDLAGELQVPLTIIPFEEPEEVLIQRIEARSRSNTDASEATVKVLKQQLATRDALQPDELRLCRSVNEILSAHLNQE